MNDDSNAWAAASPEASAPTSPTPLQNAGHWPDESPRLVGRWVGALASVVYLLLAGFSVLCIGGAAGAGVLLVRAGGDLERVIELASPEQLTGDFLFSSFLFGFGGAALLGGIMAVLLGWKPKHAMALRTPGVIVLACALFGSLFVGLFPGWLAEQIVSLFPELGENGSLQAINRMLTEGSLLDQVLMVSTVVLLAPIFEELVFRGLLWNTVERVLPSHWGQLAAFTISTVAFVLAHADLVQSPALIFTALFFGLIRWMGGSIWPCMLAHFVNNGLAAALSFLAITYGWEDGSMPGWMAALGVLVTLGFSAVLVAGRRRPAATPEAAWATAG